MNIHWLFCLEIIMWLSSAVTCTSFRRPIEYISTTTLIQPTEEDLKRDVDMTYSDFGKKLTSIKVATINACFLFSLDPDRLLGVEHMNVIVEYIEPLNMESYDSMYALDKLVGPLISAMCRRSKVFWLVTDPISYCDSDVYTAGTGFILQEKRNIETSPKPNQEQTTIDKLVPSKPNQKQTTIDILVPPKSNQEQTNNHILTPPKPNHILTPPKPNQEQTNNHFLTPPKPNQEQTNNHILTPPKPNHILIPPKLNHIVTPPKPNQEQTNNHILIPPKSNYILTPPKPNEEQTNNHILIPPKANGEQTNNHILTPPEHNQEQTNSHILTPPKYNQEQTNNQNQNNILTPPKLNGDQQRVPDRPEGNRHVGVEGESSRREIGISLDG